MFLLFPLLPFFHYPRLSSFYECSSFRRVQQITTREFKQIATAGATTAAVAEKVWGEYVAAVCQILAK